MIVTEHPILNYIVYMYFVVYLVFENRRSSTIAKMEGINSASTSA